MNQVTVFWTVFVVLAIFILYCNWKFGMLKDTSSAKKRPYSWARVQLAWWTVIVLSLFITIMVEYNTAPGLNTSTVILLGISAATITTARVIDTHDVDDDRITRHQDDDSSNFLLDILSDHDSVSITRFQTVVFNLVFGIWFIVISLAKIETPPSGNIDLIMPMISNNNLILLGLSNATYAAVKTTENRPSSPASKPSAPHPDYQLLEDMNFEEQPLG